MQIVKQIVITTVTLLILDAIWLGFLGKKFYLDGIGHLLRLSNGAIQPLWLAAIVVYIALVSGITFFVIPKANGQLLPAFLWGALFGFVAYATYDFTNLSVLKAWPIKISVIDTLWGMILCGLTSFTTVLVMTWLS